MKLSRSGNEAVIQGEGRKRGFPSGWSFSCFAWSFVNWQFQWRRWKQFGLVLLALTAFSCSVAIVPDDNSNLTKLAIAEPLHGTGYLPLYVGIHQKFFEKEGLDVEAVTFQAGGAHINAVLAGDAWAFIGGPERNAIAKLKGAELRAIAHVVDRGNVYLVAGSHLNIAPEKRQQNLAELLQGKRIAVSSYGSTPNSILRYVLSKQELDPQKDVTLIEGEHTAALAAVKTQQSDFALTTEPILTQGIRQGIWGEPVYSVPEELGSYAFSTINVRQQTIDQEPETIERFTRALYQSIRFVYDHPDKTFEIAAKEFPMMSKDDLKATLDRAFADRLWSPDGIVKPEAWKTGHDVVRRANILKEDVSYDAIMDMRFMKSAIPGSRL
ncbi:ABC transporter substrate-binding protein [Leptolyngbya ohadii]|uniref:ABC transporter substrate-binding protein n=1 Tax=Leptolyngbya ohadii TaxID=1962290 RepID=UPI000B59A1A0|nr:ABC transporter substrate-binding protein [Leptolyngbya ohadii]